MSRRLNLEAREKILSAAHALIYKRGFKGVSMEDIANAAGVKKANLFHYYPTKETLGLAVFERAIECSRKKVAEALQHGAADPIAVVESMFDQASGNMRENGCSGGCFIGNIAQELSDTHETLRHQVSNHLMEWSNQWAAFFRSKKDAGYFGSALDPQASAVSLLSLFEGAMLWCKTNRTTTALENAKQLARRHFESLRS